MDGARSIASVLHGRLQRLALPRIAGHDLTWAQRTPAIAPAVAHELAAALDHRARALGNQLTASPEPWLTRHLGVLSPAASPALREEYARRAAAAAAYREAAGITNPQQAVSPSAHRSHPELEGQRQAAIRALEIRDEADIIRSLTRGDLEARVLDAERAQAAAPPDVSRQLRVTAQAEADVRRRATDAAICQDHVQAANAQALAIQIATECRQLETANARYEEWCADTATAREAAARAKAELKRRELCQQPAGQHQSEPGSEQPTTAGWWQQFEADLAATEHALEHEHQAALASGRSWPPQREQEPQARATSGLKPGGQAARLGELLGRAVEAVECLAAENAEHAASAEYVTRIDREAWAEPRPSMQAQAQDQAEAEL